ncbi:MAG: hypothetical protein KJ077_13020 [Anaerolineae bacterium]|nr:hypothetical protein [Anaerolineae bacterium]
MNKLLKLINLFLLLLLAGCSSQAAALTDFLPKASAVPNWILVEEVRVYNRDNLFDMVDGQADAFFVYGFEQVATQRYQNPAGTILEVALWQLATPTDAYGLFTSGRSGQAIDIGNEGDRDPGSRIAFWQDRYYVQVYGRQQVLDADLQAFAQSVAASLPQGGERPALVNRLPQAHLIERGFIFFHEEISIQTEVWLGGENILGLSAQTNGLLARYDLDGTRVYLLLIQYPDAQAASTGLAALRSTGQVEGLITADSRDNLLGAVFGQGEPTAAKDLLAQALGSE